MKRYFETYVSNSVAGSANQLFFSADRPQTGRIFYKIACGGEYSYSLLFSNVIDSTFSDGSVSRRNRTCKAWTIHGAKIGKLNRNGIKKGFEEPEASDELNGNVTDLLPLTFEGKTEKTVEPGEFFASDPIKIHFDAGDYLCLETTVSGPEIPYHEESLLPAFVQTETGWKYERKTPCAGMIGCDRRVARRIGYLGDSITQGCGTGRNAYEHWNAPLSERWGTENAYWNLGIGYGRADDMATDGAWLYKAKQNDTVLLCAGVNDLLRGFSADEIIANLSKIIALLQEAGVRVILQTVPPFDYNEENAAKWREVNRRIREEIAPSVVLLFDTVPILGRENEPQRSRYGGHPNAEGCRIWAENLYAFLKEHGEIG